MRGLAIGLALAVGLLASRASADDASCIAATEGALTMRQHGKLHDALKQLAACADVACPEEVKAECSRRINDVNAAMPTLILAAKDGAGNDLADVRVHENLDACLRELSDARLFAVETGSGRRYSDVQYRSGDAFVFGPETRGLPDAVLTRVGRDQCVSIPMRPQSRSINLSNAVALIAYEAWRQLGFGGSSTAAAARQ